MLRPEMGIVPYLSIKKCFWGVRKSPVEYAMHSIEFMGLHSAN
jgi:hypothetical protein